MAKLGEGTGYRALLTVGCKVCSEIAIAFYISLLLMAKYFKYKIGKYKIYQNVNQATYLIYINLLPISLPPPWPRPAPPPSPHFPCYEIRRGKYGVSPFAYIITRFWYIL